MAKSGVNGGHVANYNIPSKFGCRLKWLMKFGLSALNIEIYEVVSDTLLLGCRIAHLLCNCSYKIKVFTFNKKVHARIHD